MLSFIAFVNLQFVCSFSLLFYTALLVVLFSTKLKSINEFYMESTSFYSISEYFWGIPKHTKTRDSIQIKKICSHLCSSEDENEPKKYLIYTKIITKRYFYTKGNIKFKLNWYKRKRNNWSLRLRRGGLP